MLRLSWRGSRNRLEGARRLTAPPFQSRSDYPSKRLVVLRLVGILALITIGLALVLYLFTRNRRYLNFAWRVFQFAVVFLIAFMALYVLERLVLMI